MSLSLILAYLCNWKVECLSISQETGSFCLTHKNLWRLYKQGKPNAPRAITQTLLQPSDS